MPQAEHRTEEAITSMSLCASLIRFQLPWPRVFDDGSATSITPNVLKNMRKVQRRKNLLQKVGIKCGQDRPWRVPAFQFVTSMLTPDLTMFDQIYSWLQLQDD